MKNSDEKDPQNEKEFAKEKTETTTNNRLEEETAHKQLETSRDPTPLDPAVNVVSGSESSTTPESSPSEPSAEPDKPLSKPSESTPSESSTEPSEPSSDEAPKPPSDPSSIEPIAIPAEGPVAPASKTDKDESGGKSTVESGTASDDASVQAADKKKKRERIHLNLIDDEEEQEKNASFDDEAYDEDGGEHAREESGDHQGKGQEENDHEEEEHEEAHEEEEQRVNFSLLSLEDMVKLMREKLDNPARANFKRDVADIKKAFYDKVNGLVEEKREHFLAEGGNLEDFKPVEDPLEGEMRELLQKYRELKAEYSRQLETTKQENLQKKQDILEQFRILMEGQERFEVTFRKFKELQKQWFAVGIVPQQNLKDLWDSYNYFVEKFNDYVRINRELRALDLKKNLELKVQLCERTEALDKEPNVVQAFKTLQKFHSRWREIGPVPRENRDEIWDRFKQATSVINKKHQEYHSKLKESLHENLERKKELCEHVEEIAAKTYKTHREWVDKTGQVLEIQKTWKTIGYAPKKDNNAIYARFRRACDAFFGNKAKFYAEAFEEQKDNLKLKLKITEKAEELSQSENWKETTNELIRLQKQWKEIGPVPRRDSDKLWRRFRAACDTFFSNKSKYFEDIDSTFEDNLKAKEIVIKEMENFKPAREKNTDLSAVEDFQTRFNEIGYVPSAKKDVIKEQFRKAQDKLLQKIGLDDAERSLFRFRNRIMGMLHSPRSEMKLNFERDKLVNKLQQLKGDIGVWENNIGFFKQSDSSEETIQGFHEKIESAHERIQLLEDKIRILDDMENEN
ncbi:MAG: DUF349 domain-containing protein [Bacteroidales bacterium]